MDLQHCLDKKEILLELADRKSLYQLLIFLERQPPQHYGVYTLVRTALLVDNPEYRVYYLRASTSSCHVENDYSVVIGARMVPLGGSNQQPSAKKCWILNAWVLDYEQLPEAYSDIEGIDWLNDDLIIFGDTYTPHPAIERFFNSKHGSGTETLLPVPLDRFVLPIEMTLGLQQLSCPDNVYVKSLESCHAQLVYDHWFYKTTSTVENIALKINQLPSAGVFLKTNDELVSWTMWNPPGGISRLYTLENHRQRGYAKLAVHYLSKRVAQAGFVPFAHMVVDNENSRKVFQSLGFKLNCFCHYYQIQANLSLSQN